MIFAYILAGLIVGLPLVLLALLLPFFGSLALLQLATTIGSWAAEMLTATLPQSMATALLAVPKFAAIAFWQTVMSSRTTCWIARNWRRSMQIFPSCLGFNYGGSACRSRPGKAARPFSKTPCGYCEPTSRPIYRQHV